MKEFIYNLLSDSGKISSKRFIAVAGLFLLFIVVIAVLAKITVSIEVIYALIGLITGSSALTLGGKPDNNSEDK